MKLLIIILIIGMLEAPVATSIILGVLFMLYIAAKCIADQRKVQRDFEAEQKKLAEEYAAQEKAERERFASEERARAAEREAQKAEWQRR